MGHTKDQYAVMKWSSQPAASWPQVNVLNPHSCVAPYFHTCQDVPYQLPRPGPGAACCRSSAKQRHPCPAPGPQ
eukprot:scaffold257136_cov28-Prasinocladus_malaysianus.AAC.1